MDSAKYLLQFCLVTILLLSKSYATLDVITGFIERNVAGTPLLHRSQSWPFDPEAGLKRAARYQQENGVHGEKLIERLGLGIDGNQERRLQEQRARDVGHLGGLNFLRP